MFSSNNPSFNSPGGSEYKTRNRNGTYKQAKLLATRACLQEHAT
ncbi:hypothetical protein AAJ76_1460004168 [Vairimorpha ceranae]|uniref:Uncharacterized protein n=1 Tax=Vairimorpha ceranae TaxID=40302 RepID=A0A0F9Z7T3_9MICR|nr:hypothetical protein AAJ76_1460004168 [Vairimorpha ceranae]KKO73999.1 hypothetical protein AAJ76_1460004168 [Vairimorpha ceranae]